MELLVAEVHHLEIVIGTLRAGFARYALKKWAITK